MREALPTLFFDFIISCDFNKSMIFFDNLYCAFQQTIVCDTLVDYISESI